MASEGLHESEQKLKPATIDHHRAITSLMEELEAVDWYDQRVDAATDDELRQILAHNRDEEKEHASMVLEWLRRRDPKLDEHLRTYLFTDKNLLAVEKVQEAAAAGEAASAAVSPSPSGGSLSIGDLRGKPGAGEIPL
jgi:ferritin-like protein